MTAAMTGADPVVRKDGVRIRRATARDAKRLSALVRRSRAYEGRYAAMVAGYRV
ncbi:GNAT family N-acetyltransferase, partial [Streptomyces sp. NPDC055078]